MGGVILSVRAQKGVQVCQVGKAVAGACLGFFQGGAPTRGRIILPYSEQIAQIAEFLRVFHEAY